MVSASDAGTFRMYPPACRRREDHAKKGTSEPVQARVKKPASSGKENVRVEQRIGKARVRRPVGMEGAKLGRANRAERTGAKRRTEPTEPVTPAKLAAIKWSGPTGNAKFPRNASLRLEKPPENAKKARNASFLRRQKLPTIIGGIMTWRFEKATVASSPFRASNAFQRCIS